MLSLLLNIMIRRVACDPTDQDAVWGVNSWGGKEPRIEGAVRIPAWEGDTFGGD